MSSSDTTRPASAAGVFYPADRFALERDISLYLENARLLPLPRKIRGMIVPHSGYSYSGGVAARAYRQILPLHYNVIIVIAASSKEDFNFISIYPGKAFETPLGELLLDKILIKELLSSNPNICLSEKGYSKSEYSLDVQLPFIKTLPYKTKIVPLMMGNQSRVTINTLLQSLLRILPGNNCLIIGSTDLSQLHPASVADALDQVAIKHVRQFSADLLASDIESQKCEMTSHGAAIVTMKVARQLGAQEAEVILHRNSGDITGNRDNVVGYMSAIFY